MTTLLVTAASSYFSVGDEIELADDGVLRQITAVVGTTITFTPATSGVLPASTRVDNWGPGASDPNVDPMIPGGSPCIDAGDNSRVSADVRDLDGDGDSAEPLPFDFAGNPRFVDIPSIGDSGIGGPPVVDFGAYERQ